MASDKAMIDEQKETSFYVTGIKDLTLLLGFLGNLSKLR